MKNLLLSSRALALVLCVTGCVLASACGGPSSTEAAGAKSAHYRGDKMAIFNAMRGAVESKWKVEKVDENKLSVQTIARWFTPEGLAAAERGGDMRDVPDQSISVALLASLKPDGDTWVVDVSPAFLKYYAGRPNPEPLSSDDMQVPGWAHGKVDALASTIHDALKQFEVQGVPAMVPAGGAAPGATAPAAAPAPAPAPAGDVPAGTAY